MSKAAQARQVALNSDQPPHPDKPPARPPDDAQQSLKVILTNATDRALVFASNASSETLGACLVGFGATTYFVFGRVGLVLIGFVGGVVLHATWENSNTSGPDEASKAKELARRREVGLDVIQRALDWRKHSAGAGTDTDARVLSLDSEHAKARDYAGFRPETASALSRFTDAVIRDYVKWWYSPILPTELSFPSTCYKTLTNFVLSLSSNLCRKRPADTFIEFTTNSSSILIVFFNELSAALSASPNTSAPEAVQTYMKMKPQCNLASIMDERLQQRKLQMVADDILESYVDLEVYRCAPARAFLQQILATTILDVTIEKSSRAEWINEWIVYLLEDGEPKIMNAIDAGVGGVTTSRTTRADSTTESPLNPLSPTTPTVSHNRTVSRAEEAMDEAMREAKRLTQMIQEQEKGRNQEERAMDLSDTSDSTTHGVKTPSSSQSELAMEDSQSTSDEKRQSSLEEDKAHTAEDVPAGDPAGAFTSFDQLAPSRLPTALTDIVQDAPLPQLEPLTLYNAKVQIFDDSEAVEKKTIKLKPVGDYLIQIEPSSNMFPGWMIPRTYADFETLHEVLRRISTIAGIDFVRVHPTPPAWKGNTKHQLRDEMERYLNDAMRFEQLAESEGMKRFLEKSRGLTQASPAKGFWPNPTDVGKGMLDVLTKAPNQVAGGGKAFLGGVSSVLGGGAAAGGSPMNASKSQSGPKSSPILSTPTSERSSMDLRRHDPAQATDIQSKAPGASRKAPSSLDLRGDSRPILQTRHSSGYGGERSPSLLNPQARNSLPAETSNTQPAARDLMSDSPSIKLPPPPENMPDDYASPLDKSQLQVQISHMSVDGTNFFDVPTPPPRSPRPLSPSHRGTPPSRTPSLVQDPRARAAANVAEEKYSKAVRAKEAEAKRTSPLTDIEAQVTIELLFAVITELYTLSSAWTLRRTLLAAAKTFLLRPGNPQLESIRVLLQETLLDANTSDTGIAAHIDKMRENCLPTEGELAKWPKERTMEEKSRLRDKARELLVKKGMPQALTSVMGAAASGEALGKVFDCLQVQEIARGVMFGLMLQAIRSVTQ